MSRTPSLPSDGDASRKGRRGGRPGDSEPPPPPAPTPSLADEAAAPGPELSSVWRCEASRPGGAGWNARADNCDVGILGRPSP